MWRHPLTGAPAISVQSLRELAWTGTNCAQHEGVDVDAIKIHQDNRAIMV